MPPKSRFRRAGKGKADHTNRTNSLEDLAGIHDQTAQIVESPIRGTVHHVPILALPKSETMSENTYVVTVLKDGNSSQNL